MPRKSKCILNARRDPPPLRRTPPRAAKERELSQEHLAELAGLDRNYIGQIERAERNVALVNIVRIAKALEIEPGELFVPFTSARLAKLR